MSSKNIFSNLIVVKRSGQRVEFNSTKIVVAIKKAFDQVRPINAEKEINKTGIDVGIYYYELIPATLKVLYIDESGNNIDPTKNINDNLK